jgi:DNA-binding response OmpR family regulator
VRAVEQEAPDLILLNDTVNDLAGLNTLGLLRQNLATDAIPIVAFSGESTEQLQEADRLWGDIMFVRKPFSAQDFASALHRVCHEGNFGGLSATDVLAGRKTAWTGRILVVDSDPGLLEWVETAMGRRQILAYCAGTPEQARKLIADEFPDVVLVDIDVPGVDVFDSLEWLRERMNVPVYAMTGFAKKQSLPRWIRGTITKPFGADEIMELMDRHEGAVPV